MRTDSSFRSFLHLLGSVVSVQAHLVAAMALQAGYWRARKGAVWGRASAQWEVGRRLEAGLGVRADLDKAIRWYFKAALRGSSKAQYRLGTLYDEGKGLTQSDSAALEWYRKAAAQGHADAMNRIGVHYENGWGVTRDRVEAGRWFLRAKRGGEETGVPRARSKPGDDEVPEAAPLCP